MITEPIAITTLVTSALEVLNVPYALGGSLASALHGAMRATMDADIVADLRLEHVTPLVQALDSAFYADSEMIKHSIQDRSSFNLIHLESTFKVDIFVAKDRRFDRSELARRQLYVLNTEPECSIFVTSPEDTVLAKLEWYLLGGETSDRQWRDVASVLKIQGVRLDFGYLARMAAELGVSELLERALGQLGEPV